MSKKLRSIKEEGIEIRNNKDYLQAVRKFKEGINLIKVKVKDADEKRTQMKVFQDEIDQVYSIEIKEKSEEANQQVLNGQFDKGIKILEKTLTIASNINDADLKNSKQNSISFLIDEAKMKLLINQGQILKNEDKLDESTNELINALNIAEKLYSTEPEGNEIVNIKNLIDENYSQKINQINKEGERLKQDGKIEEAFKILENSLKITDNIYDVERKDKEASAIKDLINEGYLDKIKPIVEQGKQLINEESIDNAIQEVKKGVSIVEKMFESKLKSTQLKDLSGLVNPLFADQAKPMLENAMEIIEKENYEESISNVTKAAQNFHDALKIINKMIDSDQKEKELERVSNLINQTCLAGIQVRKDKNIQLIKEKNFGDAISEMYSALSIAKNMACKENVDKEVDHIKALINEVYGAEINVEIEKGKELILKKEYDKANEFYSNALSITNKMYLSDEAEKLINKINNLIKNTSVKKTVSEGDVMAEQSKFTSEIQDLMKKLDIANEISDSETRDNQVRKINLSIDQVHSKEIKFIIEKIILLADKDDYDGVREELNKTLGISEKIKNIRLKDDNLSSLINTSLQIGAKLAVNKEHDKAFKIFEFSLKIVEKIENVDLKNSQLFNIKDLYKDELIVKAEIDLEQGKLDDSINYSNKIIELDVNDPEPYCIIGKVHNVKKEYDTAIENFQKAVDLYTNHLNSWNNMGLAHEFKGNYDEALNSFNKAIKIDPNFAIGWYNIGNIYKYKQEIDNAIESYSKATELDPSHSNALLFLGSIYFEEKQYDKAIGFFGKAFKLNKGIKSKLKKDIDNYIKLVDSINKKLDSLFQNK